VVEVSTLGKVLIGVGLVIVALGAAMLVGGRLGLGRLPGDVHWGKGNVRFFFPLATCLVLSIVATVLLNLFNRR
jgi:hypothetical protein